MGTQNFYLNNLVLMHCLQLFIFEQIIALT